MRMHRLGAYVTYQAHGGKEPIEVFYPLPSDKVTKVVNKKMRIDDEMWEKIKQSHNIK